MKHRWVTLIGIFFTVVTLYVAFRGIRFPEVIRTFGELDAVWAGPLVFATLFAIFIRAYRWSVMLKPIREVGVGKTYSATIIGFMANNILPMRLGELVRAYSLGKSAGVSKSSAFATIVVERAFDLLAILLFLGLALLRYSFAPWVALTGYVALGICVLLFLVMALLRWKREATLRLFVSLTGFLPSALGAKLQGYMQRFLDGLEILARGHRLVWVTVLSLATWLAMGVGFYVTGMALDLGLPPDASIVLVVVCALAVMLPSGPGFVGTFEMGARYGLMLFGVDENVAISYALFYHAVTYVSVTLLGLYYLWRENFSLRKAMEEEDAVASGSA